MLQKERNAACEGHGNTGKPQNMAPGQVEKRRGACGPAAHLDWLLRPVPVVMARRRLVVPVGAAPVSQGAG